MSNSSVKKQRYNIPLWYKPNLTIEEASVYSNIGTGKLYEMTEKQDCPFVLWIGSRRMIKRKIFEEYIANQYSIQLEKIKCAMEEIATLDDYCFLSML